MRLLVVDDEAPARRRLVRLLAELGGHEVVGEAANGLEAIARITELRPDAVLLDIRMPELDGLSLAYRHADLPPIVFTTAYDELAVQAFEVNAVDYLLKPIRRERLEVALQRVRARLGSPSGEVRRTLEALGPERSSSRIVTTAGGVIRFFDARAITRFWSQDKYTCFRADGTEHVTEESLGALEERLRAFGFLRVHRGELVNLGEVSALDVTDGMPELRLRDGQTAPVSRRSLASVKQHLGLRD